MWNQNDMEKQKESNRELKVFTVYVDKGSFACLLYNYTLMILPQIIMWETQVIIITPDTKEARCSNFKQDEMLVSFLNSTPKQFPAEYN